MDAGTRYIQCPFERTHCERCRYFKEDGFLSAEGNCIRSPETIRKKRSSTCGQFLLTGEKIVVVCDVEREHMVELEDYLKRAAGVFSDEEGEMEFKKIAVPRPAIEEANWMVGDMMMGVTGKDDGYQISQIAIILLDAEKNLHEIRYYDENGEQRGSQLMTLACKGTLKSATKVEAEFEEGEWWLTTYFDEGGYDDVSYGFGEGSSKPPSRIEALDFLREVYNNTILYDNNMPFICNVSIKEVANREEKEE